ncbi:hypothetical protein HMPREF9374_0265 [Desmospora sp. 8437]|nr:hypothetical protein HMPREF9374_0265 [Desmospora sp. 8437]
MNLEDDCDIFGCSRWGRNNGKIGAEVGLPGIRGFHQHRSGSQQLLIPVQMGHAGQHEGRLRSASVVVEPEIEVITALPAKGPRGVLVQQSSLLQSNRHIPAANRIGNQPNPLSPPGWQPALKAAVFHDIAFGTTHGNLSSVLNYKKRAINLWRRKQGPWPPPVSESPIYKRVFHG